MNFRVESHSDTGCAGHIIQFGGPTNAYAIECDPPQICESDGDCLPATLNANSFAWGNATCTASSE